MQFSSFSEFLAMGGHGLYVWLAYGATFAVLIGYPVIARFIRQRLWRELRWQQTNMEQSDESET